MTRFLWTGIVALLLAIPATGVGQVADDEVAEGRAMVQAGAEQLIRSELRLTDDEAAAFWPIYRAYQKETSAIGDRYAAMLAGYINRYDRGDLSNEYADDLLDVFFGVKRDLLDVQMSYRPKFMEALQALKVAQFYQLENKIRAELDAQLAVVVPLIDPS